jgi:hypothetical protein
MISHINLDDIVIDNQRAGQYAQIVQAAKQPVHQDDGRIIVQVLCRLRSDIQFHGKVLFFTLAG